MLQPFKAVSCAGIQSDVTSEIDGGTNLIKLNFIWKPKTAQYETGERLFLGRICVAGWQWNGGRSQSDKTTPDYVGNTVLPQLNKQIFGTIEEVKTKLEQIVTLWFNETLGIDGGG
jgi:hypothetical protein